jgi:penicillin amidase
MAVPSAPPGLLAPDEFPPWYVESDDLPLERNPERGWVACANNRLVDERYPHPLHGNWDPGFRYRRIVDSLESRKLHSPGDMRTLQLDVYSLHAVDVLPALLDLLEDAAPAWMLDDLRGWDLEMTPDSRAALLFETIYREWTRLALARRLPDELVERLMVASGALSVPVLFVDRLLRGELPAWLSDDERRELAPRAAEQAQAWIAARLGPDRERWTWGDVHRLTFKHPLGRLAGPHQRRLNVGPYPVAGSRHTVAPMVWDARDPFDVIAGPSLRFVTDMRRPEQSWIVNTLGQSGSPLSRHFRDQVEDFLQGFVHPLWPENFPPARRRVIRAEE